MLCVQFSSMVMKWRSVWRCFHIVVRTQIYTIQIKNGKMRTRTQTIYIYIFMHTITLTVIVKWKKKIEIEKYIFVDVSHSLQMIAIQIFFFLMFTYTVIHNHVMINERCHRNKPHTNTLTHNELWTSSFWHCNSCLFFPLLSRAKVKVIVFASARSHWMLYDYFRIMNYGTFYIQTFIFILILMKSIKWIYLFLRFSSSFLTTK